MAASRSSGTSWIRGEATAIARTPLFELDAELLDEAPILQDLTRQHSAELGGRVEDDLRTVAAERRAEGRIPGGVSQGGIEPIDDGGGRARRGRPRPPGIPA